MNARDIMPTPVHSVRAETPVLEIALIMTEQHISGVPVLGENGQLIGIVSQSDLMHRREIRDGAKTQVVASIVRGSRHNGSNLRQDARPPGARRNNPTGRVVSVNAAAPLAEVVAILDANKIKRVPVLHAGTLEGLITRSDLVKALSKLGPSANSTLC